MPKKSFKSKKAVRFTLAPGPIVDGKPTVLYQPVQTNKSGLTKRQRRDIISKITDIDQIMINGKPAQDVDIPDFVWEQIRGRSDLVINQKRPKEEEDYFVEEVQGDEGEYDDEQGQGDIYQVEEWQSKGQEEEEIQEGDQSWQDIQEQQDIQQQQEQTKGQQKTKGYVFQQQQFPSMSQTIQVQGKTYTLTAQQMRLLDQVIPQDYQKIDFNGLKFKKFNEDGLDLSQKDKYQKYLFKEDQKVVVIDSMQVAPTMGVVVDNDLKPSQISGNKNLMELEEALDYQGEEGAYEQMEDDFFAKMIQAQIQEQKVQQKAVKSKAVGQKVVQNNKNNQKKQKVKNVAKKGKQPVIEQKQQQDQDMDEQLDKALYNFQHGIQQNKLKKEEHFQDQSEDQDEDDSQKPFHTDYKQIQNRQELKGRDGELDWRTLTHRQKKQYMKTKVIQQHYQQLRQRQITQKMKGKNNVDAQQLHLKTIIKHIPFQQDHVMKRALEKQSQSQQEQQPQSQQQSDDDIVSFHQRTSVIATNLTVIQQPPKKKKVKKEQQWVDQQQRSKMVPQKRNKNETQEERKERKQALKQIKKDRRQQKKDFSEKFMKAKKTFPATNPNQMAYVKIY